MPRGAELARQRARLGDPETGERARGHPAASQRQLGQSPEAGEIGNSRPHLQEPGDSDLNAHMCQLARVSRPFN